ncbi:MAG: hypothetical protein Q8S02_15135 [Hydrogenophaga sp.]|nr:hypothetical protein [Hydrogenophaga sp.]
MGSILSGSRTQRGGRKALEALPTARLTLRVLHAVNRAPGPVVRPESSDLATVVHGHQQWLVELSVTPLNFGGHRRWMVCPECGGRREALHVLGDRLACRVCLGLRYGCQHENRRARLVRRIDKIRVRLGWPPGPLAPAAGKPPGMRWGTFHRLAGELDMLTDALVGNVVKWIDGAEAMLGRRGKTTV